MAVVVPSQYVGPLQYMSKWTGMDYNVLACQANEESGFNQYARSPAGALGWLQFMPGTFASWGSGDIYGIMNQARAYVGYMNHLLRVFHGDVRYALAGYNAGEGNPGAGLGYADVILGCAGGGTKTSVTKTGPGVFDTSIGHIPINRDDWGPTFRKAADKMTGAANALNLYAYMIGAHGIDG